LKVLDGSRPIPDLWTAGLWGFFAIADVNGDTYYGAPWGDGARDRAEEIGMLTFYKAEAAIAYDIENVEAYARYQQAWQIGVARVGQELGIDATNAILEFESVTGVADLISAVLDINGNIQNSSYHPGPGCGPDNLLMPV